MSKDMKLIMESFRQQNLQTERFVPAERKLDEIKDDAENLEFKMMQAIEDGERVGIQIPADIVTKWKEFHESLKALEI